MTLTCCLCRKQLNIKNAVNVEHKNIIIAHTICLQKARHIREHRRRQDRLNAEWFFYNELHC